MSDEQTVDPKFMNIIIVVATLVAVMVAGAPFYVIDEYTQGIVTEFGRPVGAPVTKAGLHVKTPFIQKVTYFDKRILEWDGDPTQIPTNDKKYIWVDPVARWRIVDPLKFYQTVGDERRAQARLDDIVDATVRDMVSTNDLIELVRNSNRIIDETAKTQSEQDVALETVKVGREKIRNEIFARSSESVKQFGIELIDVRIKRVGYINEVREKVYGRMISERKRAAEEYRSLGRGKKAEIEGKTEKELKSILSEAYKQGEIIKGQAEKASTDIYAAAYNADPDFFAFLKSLEAYHDTVKSDTTLLMSSDGEYYRYMNKSQ
jgi:membrane protease subunit HflC